MWRRPLFKNFCIWTTMQGGVESYVREHYGECNGNGDVSLTTGGHNKPGTPADALSLEYVILISVFRQTPFQVSARGRRCLSWAAAISWLIDPV